MQLMQVPAFRVARPEREAISENQRIGVPMLAGIVKLCHGAATVSVGREIADANPLDRGSDALALERDHLPVLERRQASARVANRQPRVWRDARLWS